MPFERVSPGQKFRTTPFYSSSFQNSAIDLVNATNEGRTGKPTGDASTFFSSAIVKVRNDTGADRARGEVVQLGAYLLDVIDPRRPWFEGNTLAEPVEFKYAVLRAPLKEDKIGEAQVAGVCGARVDVTDADHTHAVPVVGEHVLTSGYAGPIQLLSPPDGTGEQDVIALLNAPAVVEIWYTATSAKDPGDDSFTADVLLCLHGKFVEEEAVTIWDPDPDATKGWTIAEGTTGYATIGRDGKIYAHTAKCAE